MARTVHCVKLAATLKASICRLTRARSASVFSRMFPKKPGSKWIKLQTMLINENRLNLIEARHRKYLAEQLEKHFFGDGADQIQGLRRAEAVMLEFVVPQRRERRSTKRSCPLRRIFYGCMIFCLAFRRPCSRQTSRWRCRESPQWRDADWYAGCLDRAHP
jgi:Fe-S cluster biosynthesis and repair protein YggX